jgi:hypothetical protein
MSSTENNDWYKIPHTDTPEYMEKYDRDETIARTALKKLISNLYQEDVGILAVYSVLIQAKAALHENINRVNKGKFGEDKLDNLEEDILYAHKKLMRDQGS